MENPTVHIKHNSCIALKDPASSISHFIGAVLAVLGAFPLLYKAAHFADRLTLVSMMVFMLSLVLLYSASAMYHGVIAREAVDRRFKKFDHMMVYVLIAGTYTPMCTLVLGGKLGLFLLLLVWGIAILGMVIAGIWIYTPLWLNSTIYIAMGWIVILAMKPILRALPAGGFGWLLAGGVIYTIGGLIYAIKIPGFNERHKSFGTHEIFHLFCIAGSLCHYILMYQYVLPLCMHS